MTDQFAAKIRVDEAIGGDLDLGQYNVLNKRLNTGIFSKWGCQGH